ncbi:MAG TPA: 6-phosphogluconolactonase [Thermoanaerobaculia bacterium]|jgi:6-phosphogluconolactonase
MTSAKIVIVSDPDALARAAAVEFTTRAQAAVRARNRFAVALAGGSTPQRLYRLLADPSAPFHAQIPWEKTHLFWGDERHVPPEDPQSNYRLVREVLLSRVSMPAGNVHRIEAERPDAAEVALAYEQELRRFFVLAPGEAPRLDLVLLGMGSDGHTASLFPGTTALEERERLVAAPWVPRFNAYRITLTLPVFNRAAGVVFLVSGEDKAATLRAVFDEGSARNGLPCQRIRPLEGDLLWLVDRAAARLLPGAEKP